MSYATQDEMQNRFGDEELIRLTDPPERTGSINTQRLLEATEAANATVDAYLSGAGYSVPLSVADAGITDAACAIARFKLHRYEVRDEVLLAKDSAIAYLERIAKGMIKISSQQFTATSIVAPERQFYFAGETEKRYADLD